MIKEKRLHIRYYEDIKFLITGLAVLLLKWIWFDFTQSMLDVLAVLTYNILRQRVEPENNLD